MSRFTPSLAVWQPKRHPNQQMALLYLSVRVLRRPVIRPDVQLLRLAIVAEGGD